MSPEASESNPTCTHTVLLFASLRDRAGADRIEVAAPADATVADLRLAIAASHPALGQVLAGSRIAVDQEFRDEDFAIPADSEVAVIPPVSGG